MSNNSKKDIVVIGCGNVAWHICKKLNANYNLQVYNHQPNPILKKFKLDFSAHTHTNISALVPNAEAYFVCVSDKVLSKALNQISYLPKTALILIPSCSFDLKLAPKTLKRLAIFYPLQTFTIGQTIDWSEITIITDTLEKKSDARLTKLAQLFSKKIISLNYKQRLKLHLSAVLVNNFTNSLYVEAEKLVSELHSKMVLKDLLPLIHQTNSKLNNISPKDAQTGPAKRGDKNVMGAHLEILKNKPQLKKLYTLFSTLIENQQK